MGVEMNSDVFFIFFALSCATPAFALERMLLPSCKLSEVLHSIVLTAGTPVLSKGLKITTNASEWDKLEKFIGSRFPDQASVRDAPRASDAELVATTDYLPAFRGIDESGKRVLSGLLCIRNDFQVKKGTSVSSIHAIDPKQYVPLADSKNGTLFSRLELKVRHAREAPDGLLADGEGTVEKPGVVLPRGDIELLLADRQSFLEHRERILREGMELTLTGAGRGTKINNPVELRKMIDRIGLMHEHPDLSLGITAPELNIKYKRVAQRIAFSVPQQNLPQGVPSKFEFQLTVDRDIQITDLKENRAASYAPDERVVALKIPAEIAKLLETLDQDALAKIGLADAAELYELYRSLSKVKGTKRNSGKRARAAKLLETTVENRWIGFKSGSGRTSPVLISFEGSGFPGNYNQAIKDLKIGDRIQLPGGETFTVHGILGAGHLTKIVDIGGGWALRLPKNDGADFGWSRDRLTNAMNEFMALQPELKAAGIDVVDVDQARSRPPFGIVVRKLGSMVQGDHFISMLNWNRMPTLSEDEMATAKTALIEFLVKTWRYTDIGDFTPRQIGFDRKKKKWILFDFSLESVPPHRPLRNFDDPKTVIRTKEFENLDGPGTWKEHSVSADIEKTVMRRIVALRKEKEKTGSWFTRPSDPTYVHGELIDQVTPHPLPKGWKRSFAPHSFYFKRTVSGFVPKDDAFELVITERDRTDENMETYSALINGRYPAKVSVSIQNRDHYPAPLRAMAERAKSAGVAYLAGPDFVLTYDDAAATELEPVEY